jgi:hypothetical protein
MTYASLPAGASMHGDFRIGRVLERTGSVLARNFPIFFVVTAIANLPSFLLTQGVIPVPDDWVLALLLTGFGFIVWVVLATMSQAIVLYAAFQDMRGRSVDMGASVRVGLRRFFPVIGVAVAVTLLECLGLIAFVVPGVMFFTWWFVATPACVVEELGVSSSIGRSGQLTKGHRWGIFGLIILLSLANGIVDNAIDQIFVADSVPLLAAHAIWSAVWGAFYAILAVVTYHDLRVAKEGIDTEQIAAVFE